MFAAHRQKLRGSLLMTVLLAATSAGAQSFFFSADVPADLGGVTRLPWEVVRSDSGSYSSELVLPDGTPLDAVHRLDGGDWLLSVDSPTELGGMTWSSSDVIRFDGINFTPFFNGLSAGVPANSDVDAVFLDGGDTGALILSFDVMTTIGANTYEPADLVTFIGGSFSLYFDGSATTPVIPTSSNVTGADQRGMLVILTFDVPTTLAAATVLPGSLVSWDGASFASLYNDPTWPLSSRIDAIAFLPDPGRVPNTIVVDKSVITIGDLKIGWSAGCSTGTEDYGIYEGEIGTWYSHTMIDCLDDGGDRTEEITPSMGSQYYLVVPQNSNDEGSYGTRSTSTERTPGASTCIATQTLASCP